MCQRAGLHLQATTDVQALSGSGHYWSQCVLVLYTGGQLHPIYSPWVFQQSYRPAIWHDFTSGAEFSGCANSRSLLFKFSILRIILLKRITDINSTLGYKCTILIYWKETSMAELGACRYLAGRIIYI